jgi:sugar phosphate isomerase/epimerase
MTGKKPKISVFPKCYLDQICSGEMNLVDWIYDAVQLGGEGIEHYDGFFRSYSYEDVEPVLKALSVTNQETSMLCFSPDFTHPDPAERQRQVGRQKNAIDLSVMLGTRYCRTLSGQNYEGLSRTKGIERTVNCISKSLEYAEQRGVVLCMENHYKDGLWTRSEFAQPEDIFLEIIEQIDSPFFGVQYDPSNAIVGGYDPIVFLDKVKHRVVTMHASDRYLAPGVNLEELRQADGRRGYSENLLHGVTGRGLNDYDAIFRILAEVDFDGWISVEDGMNGLEEIGESVAFLKKMRAKYYD